MAGRPTVHPLRMRRHYSPTSGLLYNETIIRARPMNAQLYDFLSKPIGKPPPQMWGYESGGISTLQDMALRCFLNHVDGFGEEHFVGDIALFGKRIWQGVLRHLRIWQLFTTICKDHPPPKIDADESLARTYETTTHNHLPLSLVVPAISSPSLAYLTSLTLIDKITDPSISLSLLSTLSNLVVLQIVGSSCSTRETSMIDDDTLRLWNKQARYGNGFPRLKMLFLRFQVGVSERMLGELEYFPALEMVVTSRCGVKVREGKKIARERGWKMTGKAFYAYADTILEAHPLGPNYLDIVTAFLISLVHSPTTSTPVSSSPIPPPFLPSSITLPLSFVQLGRQIPSQSTNILFNVQEIECWIRDTEESRILTEEKRKRGMEREKRKVDGGKRVRRIKEGKRRDLLELWEGM
ncbi:hypothetical protein E4T39_03427 [Aureobasidium subglaciale]|nr:hypothetical protein E4T39_03427 [Aureobasidium subglaciale]